MNKKKSLQKPLFGLAALLVASAAPVHANIIISEVAPYASGNTAYEADWIELTNTGSSAVITSNLAGSGAVLIAGAINRFPYVLFVTDQIKRVEDLKGKKFGVSRIGSADNAAAVTVLEKFGIKESEITYVQAGSIPGRLAAMQTNALQSTLLQAPETLKAKEIGLRALLDFTKLDVEWQQNGVAVTRDYIKKKPDTIRRFMRAYVDAIHYNLTNPKGAQKILQKYLAIKDEKSVEEAYNEIVVKLTRRVPYPTEPGIQLFLDQLKQKNPKAGQVKPSEFTDVSFLKELESSGYIDRLYR